MNPFQAALHPLGESYFIVIPELAPLLIGALALSLLFFLLWRKERRKLSTLKAEKELIEGEEYRMFEFLHVLGIALEEDHSENKLHREIVDGITTVIDSIGGALYLLDDKHRYLHPAYITKNCPPLTGLPVEVLKKARENPEIIRSVIRLSKIPADEGILGSILTSGIPQHIHDVKNHENFRDSFVRYNNDISALIAPIRYAGKDIGVLAITRSRSSDPFTANEFQLFRSASEQSAFALGNAKIHHEASEKRKFETELRIASEVQSILLPSHGPDIPGYRISGSNKPARIVSGDYFDYIPLSQGKTAIVIADVAGKGVAAGLLMAMCRSALRNELLRETDPIKALSRINKQIFADIREDMFITLALYVLNDQDGSVQVVCAGHDKAPIVRADGSTEWIKPPGLALGLDAGDVFARVTKPQQFQLHSGDSLLLYTDGVTEALNPDLDEFGADRMLESFKKSTTKDPDQITKALYKDLRKYVNGHPQMDDITTIVIQKR